MASLSLETSNQFLRPLKNGMHVLRTVRLCITTGGHDRRRQAPCQRGVSGSYQPLLPCSPSPAHER
jgi:hypothetical protein